MVDDNPDNPFEGQPFVTLRHPGLDNRETTQPLSTARNLLRSGWEPVDDQARELLGLDPEPDPDPVPAPDADPSTTEEGN